MKRYQRGWVSVFALTALMVLLMISLGVSGMALTSMRRAERDKGALVAFHAAQAALEHQITLAFESLRPNQGEFKNSDREVDSELDSLAPGADGKTWVRPLADTSWAYIDSTVTAEGFTKRLRALVASKNVGIWNNAVFAGTGAAGRAINGNVDIRGSVHILGDGEPYSDINGNAQWDDAEAFTDVNKNGVWDPGEPFVDTNGDGVRNPAEPYNDSNANNLYDPPLTQTDLSSTFGGNAYIGNNYEGMPVSLEAQVPAAPRISGIETLATEVRVKHGRISISGTATVGTEDIVDGGTSKSKVDGVYVNDGFTGSQGAAAVFSENGASNAYDLGNLGIKFPLLSGIGSQAYTDTGGSMWVNQETYLNNRSLTIPVSSITSATSAFSYGPDAYGNSITFTPAGDKGVPPPSIHITGVVKINGDLQLGSKDTIRYTGNGTIYTTGDMYMDGNILPALGQTFPTTARMGFISKRNMYLATGAGSSQLYMAGAFYAQGRMVSAKQNQIAGTFVANFFDLGTNVPNIYQVPSLPKNMPPAMPGDMSYYSIKLKNWRQR